jgi:membrane-associated phospholipid phosphatase
MLTAFRFQRRLAPWLAIMTVLLALGAVYGGYHYATDALCGVMVGTAAVLLAPTVFRVLGGEWRGSREGR